MLPVLILAIITEFILENIVMYKKSLSLLVVIIGSLITTGCVPTTFGVPQPTWDTLDSGQQQEVIRGHYKTRVAEINNEPYYNPDREYRTENTYVYTRAPSRVYVATPPERHYYVDNTRTVNKTIIKTTQNKNYEHHKHHEHNKDQEHHKHHEHDKHHDHDKHQKHHKKYANETQYSSEIRVNSRQYNN